MNRQTIAAILLSGTLLPAVAQDKAETWQSLSSIYERHATELQAACDAKIKAALDEYANALNEAEAALAEKKDAAGLAAVRRERARVASPKTLSDPSPPDLPPQIEASCSSCRKSLAAANDAKNRRLAELTRLYIDRLFAIQRTLTAENKIEEATRVRDEVKRATFLMADALSRIEPAEPEKPEAPPKVCPRCNGTKTLVEECPLCKGTGECAGCSGTGRDPSRPAVRHTLCRGTGRCPKCGGTGKLKSPCPACPP